MHNDYVKWVEKALRDYKSAEFNLRGEQFDIALFLSQQAAEKALKALCLKRFNKLLKTHDLVLLARELKAPDAIVDHCKELSPAYVYSRYPDVAGIEDIEGTACGSCLSRRR